jgi:hypothetical protein
LIKSTKKAQKLWLLTPLFGALAFLCLYAVATFFYAGGSQADKNSKGFSWVNNYWCNLLNEDAVNGQHNPARPIALTAMFVLCLSLSFFWYHLPRSYNFGKFTRLVIQLSGIPAMTIAMFLFTGLHDSIINIAGALGIVALIGTFTGLYKAKRYILFLFGMFNLVLITLNNYVYYTKGLIIYLPVIQKISFLSFLIWVCWIDIDFYRKIKNEN